MAAKRFNLVPRVASRSLATAAGPADSNGAPKGNAVGVDTIFGLNESQIQVTATATSLASPEALI